MIKRFHWTGNTKPPEVEEWLQKQREEKTVLVDGQEYTIEWHDLKGHDEEWEGKFQLEPVG